MAAAASSGSVVLVIASDDACGVVTVVMSDRDSGAVGTQGCRSAKSGELRLTRRTRSASAR